jgi:hypothetical protein
MTCLLFNISLTDAIGPSEERLHLEASALLNRIGDVNERSNVADFVVVAASKRRVVVVDDVAAIKRSHSSLQPPPLPLGVEPVFVTVLITTSATATTAGV